MREVFKIFYQSNSRNLGFAMLGFLMSIVFLVLGLYVSQPVYDIFFLIAGVLVGCLLLLCSCVLTIFPFNAIRKFKKEFGFLPPLTPEGRVAFQRQVDYLLGESARNFLFNCSEEDRLKSVLNSFSSDEVERSSFLENVSNFESQLREKQRCLEKSKKDFWRLHAIARSFALPQPFWVLKSVHDYKDIDFYNSAKHDKKPAVVDS